MRRPARVVNIVVAGLGGQGVLTASEIIADAAFRAGFDVKKSELHGMSQRGGSVTSDVRFGGEVLSPMVPDGEADYLLLLDAGQLEHVRSCLRPDGVVIPPEMVNPAALPSKKTLNVALTGALSIHLDLAERFWLEALHARLPERLRAANLAAFHAGRAAARAVSQGADR